ncbi:glycosyltransferase family 2 protein [Methanothermococcus sp. SCGC AD-155-E23]|nr:glycosyltransferase family 2 protein [Methanothermococcus sp. SCGC AD-155-E23]
MKIAAVVVTFNRKKLLLECLNALKNQTYPLDAIFIIDGPSTDGTPEALFEQGYINELPPKKHDRLFWETKNTINNSNKLIKVYYVRIYKDIGGAGGFYEGIKRAYKKGYDWIWLMDDDSEPVEESLEYLITKIRLISKKTNIPIGFACSKVLWKDGSIHKMNIPQIQPLINDIPFNTFDNMGLLLVKACSFVSVLINREAIKKVGLPMKEFFIWGDDIEYTERISNEGYYGIYIKDSIVYHKTKNNYYVNILTDSEENAWKYFYGIRNNLYIIKKKNIFRYILNFFGSLINTNLKIILHRKTGKLKFVWINTKATFTSVFFNPKIKYIQDNKN